MLTVGAGCRVYLAAEPVDLRRGLDGLCAVVRAQLGHDPYVGDDYVFLGLRRDQTTFRIPFTHRCRVLPMASAARHAAAYLARSRQA